MPIRGSFLTLLTLALPFVLTMLGLGLLIFSWVRPAVSNLAEAINTELGDAQTCMSSNGATC